MTVLRSYAAITDQGPYLQVNEDNVFVDLVNGLFLTLDGFGGAGVGDACSEKSINHISTFYTKISQDPDSTLPFYFSQKYLIEGNALVNALMYTHDEIVNENRQKEMNNRGGVSVIAAAKSENILTIVSTGNCHGYLFRGGGLYPLLLPDSLEMRSTDSFTRHFRTSPLSGIGLFDDLHFQTKEQRLKEDDLYIFMTDGVYSRINSDELKHVVGKKDLDLKEKIQELFNISNERGNMDNQASIFLQF